MNRKIKSNPLSPIVEKAAEEAAKLGQKLARKAKGGKPKQYKKKYNQKTHRAYSEAPLAVSDTPMVRHNRERGGWHEGMVPVAQLVTPATSDFTQVYTAAVTALNPSMFPELSLEAASWEEYQMEATFMYKPTSQATRAGMIYMYIDPDCTDAVVASSQQLLYEQNASYSALWQSCSSRVPKSLVNVRRYLHKSNVPTADAEGRQNNFGQLYVFMEGADTSRTLSGWLWCKYRCRLFNRKTPGALSIAMNSGNGATFEVPNRDHANSATAPPPIGFMGSSFDRVVENNGVMLQNRYATYTKEVTTGVFLQLPCSPNTAVPTIAASEGLFPVFALDKGRGYAVSLTLRSTVSTALAAAIITSDGVYGGGSAYSPISTFSLVAGTTFTYITHVPATRAYRLLSVYLWRGGAVSLPSDSGVPVVRLAVTADNEDATVFSREDEMKAAPSPPFSLSMPYSPAALEYVQAQAGVEAITLGVLSEAYIAPYSVAKDRSKEEKTLEPPRYAGKYKAIETEEIDSPRASEESYATVPSRRAEYVGHPSTHKGGLKGGCGTQKPHQEAGTYTEQVCGICEVVNENKVEFGGAALELLCPLCLGRTLEPGEPMANLYCRWCVRGFAVDASDVCLVRKSDLRVVTDPSSRYGNWVHVIARDNSKAQGKALLFDNTPMDKTGSLVAVIFADRHMMSRADVVPCDEVSSKPDVDHRRHFPWNLVHLKADQHTHGVTLYHENGNGEHHGRFSSLLYNRIVGHPDDEVSRCVMYDIADTVSVEAHLAGRHSMCGAHNCIGCKFRFPVRGLCPARPLPECHCPSCVVGVDAAGCEVTREWYRTMRMDMDLAVMERNARKFVESGYDMKVYKDLDDEFDAYKEAISKVLPVPLESSRISLPAVLESVPEGFFDVVVDPP